MPDLHIVTDDAALQTDKAKSLISNILSPMISNLKRFVQEADTTFDWKANAGAGENNRIPYSKQSKTLLLQLICHISDFQLDEKEQALWLALLPGTYLNAIFSIDAGGCTSRGTDLNRGSLKEVVAALTKLRQWRGANIASPIESVLHLQKTQVLLARLSEKHPSLFHNLPARVRLYETCTIQPPNQPSEDPIGSTRLADITWTLKYPQVLPGQKIVREPYVR